MKTLLGFLIYLMLMGGVTAMVPPAYLEEMFIVATVIGVIWLFVKMRRDQVCKITMSDIDKMSGIEFERFLVRCFKNDGYKVEHIGAGGSDFGVDLIAKKEGNKTAIQAKRYKGRVGNEAVQQVVAGAAYYKCDYAAVITNSEFTKAAIKQARETMNHKNQRFVTLWDRNFLRGYLEVWLGSRDGW